MDTTLVWRSRLSSMGGSAILSAWATTLGLHAGQP
jgi:hypothetical protein